MKFKVHILPFFSAKIKVLLIFVFYASFAFAQTFTEYEIKASYLANLYNFVTWPESVNANPNPLVIGIYGDNPFGDILVKMIELQKKKNSSLQVNTIRSLSDISNCQILFVSGLKASEVINMLNFTNQRPILTVGDNIPKFCEYGGIINFTPSNSKKIFEINADASKNAGLRISSKLMILSKITNSEKP